MVPPRVAAMRDNQVMQLIRLSDECARRRLVRRSTSLHHPAMVEWLYEEVVRRAHADLQQAERLAEAADWIAVEINDDASRAVGWRALGHIRFLRGQHKQALKYYRAALVLFRRLGRDLDVGRTLNGALQCLIYLGKYDQALVLYQGNRFAEARRLAQAALKFFSHVPISGKAALSELLLARLYLHEGQTRLAGRMCRAALHRLGEIESPALSYQTYFVLGQIQEARGNQRAALQAYQNAHQRLENLRSQISAEELKIAFLKDKLSVYESLVDHRDGPEMLPSPC